MPGGAALKGPKKFKKFKKKNKEEGEGEEVEEERDINLENLQRYFAPKVYF